ncbi:hypothetical protein KCP76_26160 (plasmid) [Salmonella enterica subsp. enterica serovar Weltevreden]|nr:hypothetical protein KCP76_26160 [Salmonella enterica subsp. enterica serovar Weltevreden]QUI99512.1 hypothetical protein KCP74_25590 [Salmonella enterica subsp. enterica]QUJ01281.1 hypothetical protein KCP73_26900 [Salmonella enterica subsp. enterica]
MSSHISRSRSGIRRVEGRQQRHYHRSINAGRSSVSHTCSLRRGYHHRRFTTLRECTCTVCHVYQSPRSARQVAAPAGIAREAACS